MDRCNELCTKEVAGYCGYCALCNVLAERDRFIRVWLKGGLFLDCYDWLIARLQDRSKAPGRWLYPVPRTEVRHKDVVREAHKQYSETLNKTMLTLLGVAFFGYALKAGQLTYDCRYSTMHGMPVTGGRGFRGLKPLWYNSVPP